jgi:hypothetical protein
VDVGHKRWFTRPPRVVSFITMRRAGPVGRTLWILLGFVVLPFASGACGGKVKNPTRALAGGSGGSNTIGDSASGGTSAVLDAATGGGPQDAGSDVIAQYRDGSFVSDPGCECPPGDYFIEVLGDGEPQIFTYAYPYSADELPCYAVTPVRVPWGIGQGPATPGYVTTSLEGCLSEDPIRSCIRVVGPGGMNEYADRGGRGWPLLIDGPVLADSIESPGYPAYAYVLVGSYSALLGSDSGGILSGRFRICAVGWTTFL